MNIEGVVIFEASSGIPLYSKLDGKIDPSLFSSFIAAIGHFSKDLALGGLSSFTTEEKVIFLAASDQTITALITPKSAEYQVAYQLAANLGNQFEERFDIQGPPQPNEYNRFSHTVDDFLKKMRHPFLNRVAIFVHEQYGGEISIKPKLMTRNGSTGEIDILLKTGSKQSGDNNGKKTAGKAASILSEELTFVKAVDDEISRGEILDFIDSTDGFGSLMMVKDELEFQPYFPACAIVIGREYSENVFEFVKKLPSDKGRPYIDGTHLFLGTKMKNAPKDSKCYLEIWKWHDDRSPESMVG
ncbi:MAG: hypothetical protein RTU30_02875 [Candidatus Thorarchaeota archaeon]